MNPNRLVITLLFNGFKFLIEIQRVSDWIFKKISSLYYLNDMQKS